MNLKATSFCKTDVNIPMVLMSMKNCKRVTSWYSLLRFSISVSQKDKTVASSEFRKMLV